MDENDKPVTATTMKKILIVMAGGVALTMLYVLALIAIMVISLLDHGPSVVIIIAVFVAGMIATWQLVNDYNSN